MNFKILKFKKPYLFAYLVISIFFITWMIFLDTHSLLVHLELSKEINNLEKRKKFLEGQIEKDNKLILDLNNIDSLEKFARETYWHKKENQTILITE